MARGKIGEYEVTSFSPQAVGVPQQDRSGQIIAAGMESLGKALADRQTTSNNLSAQEKFGEFEFNYQQKKLDLQRAYADKPGEYPAAVKKMSDDLSDSMGKDMPGGVFAKFKQLTNNSSIQDMDGNAKWAFARDNEIQVGKIGAIKQNIALKAATVNSPEGLKGIFADFAAASLESTKFITAESDEKLTTAAKKLAITYALDAQLMSRPMGLKTDLEGGAYNGLIEQDIITSYAGKARNAIYNKAIDEQYRTLFKAEGKILDFQKGIDDGSVTIVDLIAEREAMNANRKKVDALGQPVVSPGYVRNLDSMIDALTQSRLRSYTGKQARESALTEFDRDWDKYLQVKATDMKPPDFKDLDKELEIYSKLRDQYSQGVIDKNDFDQKVAIMNTKYQLKKGSIAGAKPFDQAVDQAGMVAGFWGPRPGNDVVSLGYSMIKDTVDKTYPELSVDERRSLKAQMLAKFHQTVVATPAESLSEQKTEEDRKNFAHKLVFGGVTPEGGQTPGIAQTYSSYKAPDGRVFKVGDTDTDPLGGVKTFAGRSRTTGKPVWFLPPAMKDKQVTYNGRKYKAVSIDTNTGAIKWELLNNG